jgi:hypothetical protein
MAEAALEGNELGKEGEGARPPEEIKFMRMVVEGKSYEFAMTNMTTPKKRAQGLWHCAQSLGGEA